MTQQSGQKVIISKLQLSCLMYLPLGWYLLSAPQWQLLSDWVAQFGFWCLPRWIQFGFSITSCYPRKPQGPIGHWRPPHESLYFLQTRLRGRGGHSPSSTQTLQTIQRVGEKGGERSHGASPPALSPINQTFPLRLCCSLWWLPQSSLFSLSNTPHWWAQLCCMLPVAVTKSNVLAMQKKNHKRLGNDADISHATVQRAALQPGPDEDWVTYWMVTPASWDGSNLVRDCNSTKEI